MYTQLPLFGKQEHKSRDDRKDQIFEFLQNVPFPVTARQIADWLGMSKSPHFMGILFDMIEDGTVVRTPGRISNGLEASMYSIHDDYKSEE